MSDAPNVLLAVGAHAGDMEVSCGAVLAKHARRGDTVVLLHLTLGEGGNPALPPAAYGEQKRREAEAVASSMGARVLFGPYRDGELPCNDGSKRYVADVIRQVQPTHIITHWRRSIHPDHAAAHAIVNDAVLLASLEAVVTPHERHRGVRAVYFTENWEDPEDYVPYLFVDVAGELDGGGGGPVPGDSDARGPLAGRQRGRARRRRRTGAQRLRRPQVRPARTG